MLLAQGRWQSGDSSPDATANGPVEPSVTFPGQYPLKADPDQDAFF